MLPIPHHTPKINPTNPTQPCFRGGRLQQAKCLGHGQDKEPIPCPHPAPSPRADTHSTSELSFPAARFPSGTLDLMQQHSELRSQHRKQLEKGLHGRNPALRHPQTEPRWKEPQGHIRFHWGTF